MALAHALCRQDAQARVTYMLALFRGNPMQAAFELALASWHAQNANVSEPVARRALIRLLARTVWHGGTSQQPVPRQQHTA